MELHELPALLTIEAAAEFLRLSTVEVRRAMMNGDLPTVRHCGTCYVDARCLLGELGVCTSNLISSTRVRATIEQLHDVASVRHIETIRTPSGTDTRRIGAD